MKQTLTIDGNTRLGELVTFFPAITSRLNELHIDYCCQGDRTLDEAIKEAGLSPDFLAQVQKAYAEYLARPGKEAPITELSDEELIDLILDTHHLTERALWKELDKLVNLILLVHYEHGKELMLNVHRGFSELKMELEEHFAKEEKELFPAMLKEGKTARELTAIRTLISELEGEHDGAGKIIKRLLRDTDDFTPPVYACPTVKNVYSKLHELVDDIFLHIAKENSVLFKRYQ